MGALFSSAYPMRAGIRRGLIAHAAAMFSFVTIFTAINLDIQSISYIDNREFSDDSDMFPPGPLGYQFSILYNAIGVSVVPTIMFYLNTCLADGLLVSYVSSSVAQVSKIDCPLALSLLCNLRHELPGYCPANPDVPCLFWYVLGSEGQ